MSFPTSAVNALEFGTVLVFAAMLPLVAFIAWLTATMRPLADQAPRTAWCYSIAEIGAVAGTLPWLVLVLTPRGGEGAVQTMPFADLADLVAASPQTIVEQLVGNLILFAAAGFLLPIRFPIGLGTVALGALFGSTLVEAAQYLIGTGRVASVDDILLNTVGAVLAAMLSHHWWRRSPGRNAVRPSVESGVLRFVRRDWRGSSMTEVSRGTDRAARC